MPPARSPVPPHRPARQPTPERYGDEHLPFGVEFQKAFVRLLCEDPVLVAGWMQTPYWLW